MDTPGKLRNSEMEGRVEALERRHGNIINIDEKLDCILNDDIFRKEVYNLTKENCSLLKNKMDLESKYAILCKQCEELRKRITEMERKFIEGEKWGKFEEAKKNNEEVHTNLREIIKQKKEKSELAQHEIVESHTTKRDHGEEYC
ncbi:hypothetical protein E2C01_056194 [Portunus trituberculatus]|uniref:Uncharacterized protein n=1 Tax=Portunus trituberculatus TaxID=210409 RepID=A0A5B7GPP4_PORTR|nr:hypothetical protein [Portunus trituberculatus]